MGENSKIEWTDHTILVPHAFKRLGRAIERHMRREKRIMAMLGINEETLAMMREITRQQQQRRID